MIEFLSFIDVTTALRVEFFGWTIALLLLIAFLLWGLYSSIFGGPDGS